MNKKYNNGKPLNVPENSEEMSLAISEWSENNKSLENAIRSCIENKIPTYASCAGHYFQEWPYLSMKVNKENLGYILNIMNNVSRIKNTQISISYVESQGTILTVTSDIMHRKSMFDTVAKSTEKAINIEETSPIVQEVWNAHKELRMHDAAHCVEFQNFRFSKRLTVRPYCYELFPILDESILKKDVDNRYYYKTFFAEKNVGMFLKDMLEKVKTVCEKKGYDEFEDVQQHENDFKDEIKHPIKPVNLENQNETENKPEIETEIED